MFCLIIVYYRNFRMSMCFDKKFRKIPQIVEVHSLWCCVLSNLPIKRGGVLKKLSEKVKELAKKNSIAISKMLSDCNITKSFIYDISEREVTPTNQ